jgi:iron complex outermembrane recepter protein
MRTVASFHGCGRTCVRRSALGMVLFRLPAALAAAALMAPAIAGAQQNGTNAGASAVTLPEIRVIAATPVAPPRSAPPAAAAAAANAPPPAQPGVVDRDKIPANVQVLTAADFDHARAPDLLQAMERALPGVSLGDQAGNQFQLDINYRGFVASPVIGTPQGLAVYQNGVRINEVFGDIINWDFLPENAINRMTLVPSNPVYGLNAIGGALSLEMKNGFTYHGVESEVRGGSYGRIGTSVQAGGQNGNFSGYFTADAIDDAGWRQDSPSSLRRVYADLGARGDNNTEFHVSFTGADNHFGALVATPVQMLAQNWASVFTAPQTTENQLAFLTASASWKPSDTLTYQAIAYFRHYQQAHVDGNGTNAQNSGCPDPTVLCYPNIDGTLVNLITTTGHTVSALGPLGSALLGEIDRTWTTTNSFGGSAQAASSEKVFGHPNNFVIGASLDRGLVQFSTTSELATISGIPPLVQGTGLFIDQPSGDNAPVGLGAQTFYAGLYATDTLDLTSRLSITAGARFNFAQINLLDELGDDPLLTGNHSYSHFNPSIGATYKITPNVTAFGGYAVANRAPTPLELECSDPARPCLLDNSLVGDPSLKQVVSHTVEAGLRGNFAIAGGQLNWNIDGYYALNIDDIINVASPIIGHEFFQNGGDTLRRGIEAGATYKRDRWNVYANFTSVDATFRNALTLSSPFNPFANANGLIFVVPGDHIPGIPDFRFKAGAEYQVTPPWKIGADLNVVGSQYLVGDASNQNPKIPAYWVVNLHSSYQVTKNVEVFGLVKNLFNQRYYVSGTFFDTGEVPYLNLTDPRTFLPGMPFAAYVGVRGTLPDAGHAFAAEPPAPILTKAPAPAGWNWTGLYLGLNGGYSFGGSDWTDGVTGGSTGNFNTSGFVFGGTLGGNYQVGPWVFGVEADDDWSDVSGFGTFTATSLCAGGCLTKNNWLATVRGRVGYAFDRFLVYGTGGAAFGDVRAGFSNDPVTDASGTGWAAGAGIEVAVASNWTAKAEYLFVDLPNGSCTANCAIQNPSGPPLVPNVAVKFNESIVRLGINYKLAPVTR